MVWTLALAVVMAAGLSGAAIDASARSQPLVAPEQAVVRAGHNHQTLGRLELRNRRRAVTYADAIAAFGRASSCRRFARANNGLATWSTFGVRIRLSTLGVLPPGRNACTAPTYVHIDWARAAGAQWQTGLGLRTGDVVDDLRTLYPKAIYQRRRIGNWPARSYWIVHVRERCVIGICRRRFETVPRLIAEIRGGRVVGFFFPVGSQGE